MQQNSWVDAVSSSTGCRVDELQLFNDRVRAFVFTTLSFTSSSSWCGWRWTQQTSDGEVVATSGWRHHCADVIGDVTTLRLISHHYGNVVCVRLRVFVFVCHLWPNQFSHLSRGQPLWPISAGVPACWVELQKATNHAIGRRLRNCPVCHLAPGDCPHASLTMIVITLTTATAIVAYRQNSSSSSSSSTICRLITSLPRHDGVVVASPTRRAYSHLRGRTRATK